MLALYLRPLGLTLAALLLAGCTQNKVLIDSSIAEPTAENLEVRAALKWFDNFDEGQAEARKLRLPMFVAYLTPDTDLVSRRLQRDVFESKVFADTVRERFVLVRVNLPGSKTPEANTELERNTSFASRYNVLRVPDVIVLSPGGDLWLRYPLPVYRGSNPKSWIEEFEIRLINTPIPSRAQLPEPE